MKIQLITILFLTLLSQSHAQAFTQLAGNHYIFSINKIAIHPEVSYPSNMLYEEDYIESTQDIQYKVIFSDDLKSIQILSKKLILGEIKIDNSMEKTYAITKGLFAGGRFRVWMVEGDFKAEFTVYGSGVPIIKSERGGLRLYE